MDYQSLNKVLSEAVKTSVSVTGLGRNSYQVISPFEFSDGDEFVVYLDITNDEVKFTDRGHTLMHVSYDVDITSTTRQKVVEEAIANFGLTIDDGEIYTIASLSEIKNAFWDYMQGLIRVSDVSQWKFERAASLFFQEFELFMESRVKPNISKVDKDWFDYNVDSEGLYAIPWVCQNGSDPLFVFPINSNNDCSQAIISSLKYKESNFRFESLAVFSDIDRIRSKIRNQCLDTIGKAYSNFAPSNQEEARIYISTHV